MTLHPRKIIALASMILLILSTASLWAQDSQEGASQEPSQPPASAIDRAINSAVERGQMASTSDSSVVAAPGATESPIQPPSDDELFLELTDPTISSEVVAQRILPLSTTELSHLAQAWQGIAKGMTKAVVEEQIAITTQERAGGDVSRERLAQLIDLRNSAFENLTTIASGLEAKGGDQAEIDGYRAYRSAIRVDETQRADWRTLVTQVMNWTTDRDGGVEVAIRVSVIIASLLGLFIVARMTRSFADRALARVGNLSKLLKAFLVMVVYWLTIAFGLMIVLSALGINVTPLFALVGGASFIIAFAMQDTLGNLAAGLMIMINRPFDEGDYVTVAGTGGTVQSVSIVSTKVLTPDNQVIIIPNSKVWGDVITNVTASKTRRVDFTFSIGYDDSIEKAQRVLEETISRNPLILSEPAPIIRVNALGASSVDFICRPWVKVEDYWTVYWDTTREVKEAFDRAGITIPYPQTETHVRMASYGNLPIAESDDRARTMTKPKGEPRENVSSFSEGDEGPDDET